MPAIMALNVNGAKWTFPTIPAKPKTGPYVSQWTSKRGRHLRPLEGCRGLVELAKPSWNNIPDKIIWAILKGRLEVTITTDGTFMAHANGGSS